MIIRAKKLICEVKQQQWGFTLVELIVVMAILSIIASVGVIRYGGVLERFKISADNASLSILNNATHTYAANNGITSPDIFAGNSIIPASNTDTWWTDQHDTKIIVTNLTSGSNGNNRNAAVYIDGNLMFNYEYKSDIT